MTMRPLPAALRRDGGARYSARLRSRQAFPRDIPCEYSPSRRNPVHDALVLPERFDVTERFAGVSKTSIWVAAGRAIGSREPDPAARNPDHLAERLLGDPADLPIDHPVIRALRLPYDEAMSDVEVVSNVRMMMVRTRFIDGALTRAVNDGVQQVAILGAGFDTHAYRFETLLAGVKVFEVDRLATQALKRQRVIATIGRVPANLVYVPVDLQHEDWRTALTRHGYDPALRTFFILEGVTMYVPAAAARDTFAFIGTHPSGSAVVFDFVHQTAIDLLARLDIANVPEPMRPFLQRFFDLIKDEPWVFGLPGGAEREFLGEFGLELREMLTVGGDESVRRYATRSDGTPVGAAAVAAAMARMAARNQEAGEPPERASVPADRTRDRQPMMSYQLAEAVVS
jgi:methyltransferase (TIGR00027 family)